MPPSSLVMHPRTEHSTSQSVFPVLSPTCCEPSEDDIAPTAECGALQGFKQLSALEAHVP